MAYKFQLGDARLSGALEQDGNITVKSGSSEVIGVEATLGSGQFLAQLKYDGATESGYLEIASGSGEVNFYASEKLSGSVMNTLAGNGLSFTQGTGVMAVNVDTNSIEINSDTLRIVSGGVDTNQLANDSVTLAKMANLTRGTIIVGDSSNDPSNLSLGSAGQILISSGSDLKYVSLSSDATIDAAGALTIANDAVDNNKLANMTQGTIKVGGALNAPTDLDAKTSGYIIVGDGSGVASVEVTGDISLASNGAVTIAANAVEGSMINSNVAGTGLEYTSNTLAVSASQTVITDILNDSLKIGRADGNDAIDFGTDDQIDFFIDGTTASDLEMRIESGSVTIYGDLNVQGTTTTIDSANIFVTGGISFEGSTNNGFETTLDVIDPSADRTISLPDLSANGTIAVFSDSSFSATNITPSPITLTELNLLDGGTARGTTAVADGDGFIHNDGGTMRMTNVTSLATYVGNNISETVQTVNSATDISSSAGAIVLAQSASSAYTLTLEPASDSSGKIFKIKREDGANVTIASAGGNIDNASTIVLESEYAAVMVFSDGSNYYVI